MVKTKRNRCPGGKRKGRDLPPNGNGGDEPTEAVFRVDLKTGKMRITDQKGDELVGGPSHAGKTRRYGIEADGSDLLAVIFYAKCNIKHGGCVIKIVRGREMLVW